MRRACVVGAKRVTLASAAYLHTPMLSTYEHALQACNPHPPLRSEPDPPRTNRGPITGFSRDSRRRLLRLLSTVRTSKLPPARFLTLTWHRVPDDWHAQALAFREYVRRRGGYYFWRLEAQKRGAPHLHYIVWCEDWDSAHARETWHRIASEGSDAHLQYGFRDDELESYAQVFAYVSHYVASTKHAIPAEMFGRRMWGASRDLPRTATGWSDQLSEAGYYALRRLASRLLRARARAAAAKRSAEGRAPRRRRRVRQVSPVSMHLYLRTGDAERIARWLEVPLIDPLWLDTRALMDAIASLPRARPEPRPAFVYRGQCDAFGPVGAMLR